MLTASKKREGIERVEYTLNILKCVHNAIEMSSVWLFFFGRIEPRKKEEITKKIFKFNGSTGRKKSFEFSEVCKQFKINDRHSNKKI